MRIKLHPFLSITATNNGFANSSNYFKSNYFKNLLSLNFLLELVFWEIEKRCKGKLGFSNNESFYPVIELPSALSMLEQIRMNECKTIIFTPFVSNFDLVMQFLAVESHISTAKLLRGNLSKEDLAELDEAKNRLRELNVWFDDNKNLKATKILTLRCERSVDMIIINLENQMENCKSLNSYKNDKFGSLLAEKINAFVSIYYTQKSAESRTVMCINKTFRPIDIDLVKSLQKGREIDEENTDLYQEYIKNGEYGDLDC